MIRILSRTFLKSVTDIYMSATNGKAIEGITFLVNLLKFESDTATSKNIAIRL